MFRVQGLVERWQASKWQTAACTNRPSPTLMLLSVMAVLQDRLPEGSMMGCRPKMPALSLCLLQPAGKTTASTAHAGLPAGMCASADPCFLA